MAIDPFYVMTSQTPAMMRIQVEKGKIAYISTKNGTLNEVREYKKIQQINLDGKDETLMVNFSINSAIAPDKITLKLAFERIENPNNLGYRIRPVDANGELDLSFSPVISLSSEKYKKVDNDLFWLKSKA